MSLAAEHGLWAPVVMSTRKDKSAFGRLPREVRDKVIAGLDSGALTLDDAAEILDAQGHELSRSAIGAAYNKLRRIRRSQRNKESLAQLMADFSAQPGEKAFDALAKLLAAQTAELLMNDEESSSGTIKATARALDSMAQLAKLGLERARLERRNERDTGSKDAPKSTDEILEQVYGISR